MWEPRHLLKDMRRGLIENGIKEVVPSGQESTQLILPFLKGKEPRDFLHPKSNYKGFYANVIQERGGDPFQEGSRIQQCPLHSSGFRVMNNTREKRL